MIKANKLSLLGVVMALFVAGCGKKSCNDKDAKNKKMASSSVPTYREESENLLADADLSEFSFVDDSKDENLVAANDDLENSELADQDAEASTAAFKTVHFDFNKNNIRKDQRLAVKEDVEVAKEVLSQGRKVVVEGHCCQMGPASYNLALSQQRAESIKAEFVKAGIPADEIKTIGFGYERPVVWSDAQSRKQLIAELAPNRRAELRDVTA